MAIQGKRWHNGCISNGLACTVLLFFQCPQMVSVAVDVKEVSTAYIFEGDMPGLKNTDIKVHLHKRMSLCRTLMLHENHMIDYNSEWIYYRMTFPLEREPWFVSQGVIYMACQKQKVMDTWYYHYGCQFLRHDFTQLIAFWTFGCPAHWEFPGPIWVSNKIKVPKCS